MVKLGAMPDREVVDGFKGSVDFYIYKDTAVARKWPIWRPREAHPNEAANQSAFAYINRVARTLPTFIIDQYKAQAQGTPLTWKDLLVRSYMKGIDY